MEKKYFICYQNFYSGENMLSISALKKIENSTEKILNEY